VRIYAWICQKVDSAATASENDRRGEHKKPDQQRLEVDHLGTSLNSQIKSLRDAPRTSS
jgi:hypothetical protein